MASPDSENDFGGFGGTPRTSGEVKESEVIASEMETRLRQMITRILRPSLEEIRRHKLELDSLRAQVERHECTMAMAEQLREMVDGQKQFADVLADTFNTHQKQSLEFQQSTLKALLDLRLLTGERDNRLEEMHAALTQVNREASRFGEEIHRLEQQQIQSTARLMKSLNDNVRHIVKTESELMEHIRELQRYREDIMEELFADNRLIAKIKLDLKQLAEFVKPLPELKERLDKACVDVSDLQKQAIEALSHFDAIESRVEDFQTSIAKELVNVQESFKKQSNELLAHHAAVMKSIREDYAQEINASKLAWTDFTAFRLKTEKFCNELVGLINGLSERIDAVQRELVTDVDEVRRRSKSERTGLSKSLDELRCDMAVNWEASQALRMTTAYLDRLLGLVLEGERVTNAMILQDFADRSGERWLGLPSNRARTAQPAMTAEDLQKQGGSRHRHTAPTQSDLVKIDHRGALCNDLYLPGKVSYGDRLFERQDLLLLHSRLLQKAHAAYKQNLHRSDAVDVPDSIVEALRSAKAEDVLVKPLSKLSMLRSEQKAFTLERMLLSLKSRNESMDDGSEDLRLNSVMSHHECQKRSGDGSEELRLNSVMSHRGSQQRPGSQGQPQAMGSLGTTGASLGDTDTSLGMVSPSWPSPPSARLPAINGGDASTPNGGGCGDRSCLSTASTRGGSPSAPAPAASAQCSAPAGGSPALPVLGKRLAAK
mmetsp:Transcript_70171/g.195254  ORF Transcript_70171/g.195254 Transcript_70171/m.195254 type:complete len:716 (+) Transcript_70171:61-2208(+)